METVFNKIIAEIENIKSINVDDFDSSLFFDAQLNLLIDVILFFKVELCEAGYQDRILEAMEYFNEHKNNTLQE